MKHGKRFRAEVAKSLPEWEHMFMCYKGLKKQVKMINPHCHLSGRKRPREGNEGGSNYGELDSSPHDNIGFNMLLDTELNKINSFFIDKEEDYIITFRELEIMAEDLDDEEELLEVQKDILDFHAEMVMLLHYSVFNFLSLIKIVKKHRKRTGGSVDSTPTVLQQPFFSTDLLYNLIRGCEALLDRLSPPSDP